MLVNIFNRLFRFDKSSHARIAKLRAKKVEADELRSMGKLHDAINVYREYLQVERFDVDALNSLGACLDDIGDDEAGTECFELAYSIDDTYIAGVVNYAKKLADKRDSGRALELLKHVNICEPNYPHVFSIYASICFSRGDSERAADFQLKGWMGSFDSLRAANSFLFTLAYSGAEQRLASEHKFWAKTLRKVDLSKELGTSRIKTDSALSGGLSSPDGQRIRIGYWSPDLRRHSVSYFFRPLLENHDRSRYEVFVYHDSFKSDEVTDAIKVSCDHFHDVYLLNDVELYELMVSHQLDVLVEMAGHTSTNRLMLFEGIRFARLQVSGIGYPPTTGLSAIDAKLLDAHIAKAGDSKYYAEEQMILPSSFWCFDPMEAQGVKVVDKLPLEKNGYITYACVGNISKISKGVMASWVRIMNAVPNSRLLIRSISFEDVSSRDAFAAQMRAAGIDLARVDLKIAVGGDAFFDSYNEIDIILDTYPFGGGTTTCFATYMGVPVITMAGDSLISRMGLSVMTNLNFGEWVAADNDSYVENAIKASRDVGFLRDFRINARKRFKSSALGNGKIFAAEFERACEEFLDRRNDQRDSYVDNIPALPAAELVRRTYAVWHSGNTDAAARILRYCLDVYPNYGGAHVFVAMQMGLSGDFAAAIDYLVSRVSIFDKDDQIAALISVVRWCLLLGDRSSAAHWVARALSLEPSDRFDAMQLRLFQTRVSCCSEIFVGAPTVSRDQHFVVLIPCDDVDYFQAMEMRLISLCRVPDGCRVTYVRCSEKERMFQYEKWLNASGHDVLILMQRVVEIVNENFFDDVLVALATYDVVGIAGAQRWIKPNWRGDKFDVKTAGFITESTELDGMLELQCLGPDGAGVLVGGQAVLDGVLLAFSANLEFPQFESELSLLNWALEEDWTHELFKAGKSLAVHRNLGVLVHSAQHQDRRLGYPGLQRLQDKYQFPLFTLEGDDTMVLSVPVQDVREGLAVMSGFCSKGHPSS